MMKTSPREMKSLAAIIQLPSQNDLSNPGLLSPGVELFPNLTAKQVGGGVNL